jgi:hypothetical protein
MLPSVDASMCMHAFILAFMQWRAAEVGVNVDWERAGRVF